MSVYTNNKFKNMGENDSWFKLASFITPKAKILDIGCSSGNLGAYLKKAKDVYVVGLDIDKDDLNRAKKVLDEAYVHNIETDSLDQFGKFDIVIMADVVEHLVNPVAALKKVKDAIKPGGRFVFSIPNMANVTTRIELLRGRFEYKDFGLLDRTHIHFYDVYEVNRVFSEAGFEVVETDCPVRDIPEPVLKSALKEVGIELTPKLAKHLHETEALVYQFVGYAQVAKKPRSFKPKTTSHLDVISRQMDEMKAAHQAEVSQKISEIKQLDKEFQTLKQEHDKILNSKGWKALTKVYSTKHKVNRLTRRK